MGYYKMLNSVSQCLRKQNMRRRRDIRVLGELCPPEYLLRVKLHTSGARDPYCLCFKAVRMRSDQRDSHMRAMRVARVARLGVTSRC